MTNLTDKLLTVLNIVLFVIAIVCLAIYISRKIKENYDWNIGMLTDVQHKIKQSKKYNLFTDKNPLQKYPIFYINLDRSVDRNNMMVNQLDTVFNTKYTRIKAVDGSKIKNNYKDSVDGDSFINDYENAVPNRKNRVAKLSTSEIGCTLSHIKAIREIHNKKHDYAIVMEDDCLLHLIPFWGIDIDYIIANAPKDWGIIQMHIFNKKCKSDNKSMFTELKLNNPCHSTAVYLINKKGVRNVLDVCGYKGEMKIKLKDFGGVADEYIYYLTKTYYMTTPLFLTADEQHKSTIHEKHSGYHIDASNEIIKNYKKINDHSINSYINKDLDFQIEMAEVLFDLDYFMRDINVRFYLDKETLLSAYREGKFINSINEISISVLKSKLDKSKLDKSKLDKSKLDKLKQGNNKFKLERELGDVNNGYVIILNHLQSNKNVIIYLLHGNSKNLLDNLHSYSKNTNGIYRYPKKSKIYNINLFGKRFNCIGPIEENLIALYGVNWNWNYIPVNSTENSNSTEVRISKIWPRKLKEIEKPVIWMYYNNDHNDVKQYVDIVKAKCPLFEVIVLNDDIFESISRNCSKNFRNINNKYEYIKFCIIDEYGGIFIDYNVILIKNVNFILNDLTKYNSVYFNKEEENKQENKENINFDTTILAGRPNNKICSKFKFMIENDPGWINSNEVKEYMNDLNRLYPLEFKKYNSETNIYLWSKGDKDFNYLKNFILIKVDENEIKNNVGKIINKVK